MEKLALLLETLKQFNQQNEQSFAKRIESLRSENGGMSPTVDANGRLHAPCAGYVQDDSVYGAGEYLPLEGEREGHKANAKIKIKLQSFAEIKKVWDEVSHGKAWDDNGIAVCYAYFEGLTQAQAKKLHAEFSGDTQKRLVLAADAGGLDHGKVFKLTARSIASDYRDAVRSGSDAAYHFFYQKMDVEGWKMDIDKKGKRVFLHQHKGKDVCFVYEKPELP